MNFSRSALLQRQALEAAQLSTYPRTIAVRNTALEPVATTREGFVGSLGTLFGGPDATALPTLQQLLEQAAAEDRAIGALHVQHSNDPSVMTLWGDWRTYYGQGPLDASTPFASQMAAAAVGGPEAQTIAKTLELFRGRRESLETWAKVGGGLGQAVGGANNVRTLAIVGGVAAAGLVVYLIARKRKPSR